MEMEYVVIGYLLVCAVSALINPFSVRGNPLGRYLARFVVCVVATPLIYFFLVGSVATSAFDAKTTRPNWQGSRSRK